MGKDYDFIKFRDNARQEIIEAFRIPKGYFGKVHKPTAMGIAELKSAVYYLMEKLFSPTPPNGEGE